MKYLYVNGEIFVDGEHIRYKEDVFELIEDNKTAIADAKQEITMLAAGRVKDLIPVVDEEGNQVDIPRTLRWKLEDLFETIENSQMEIWRLQFLLENWDNRYEDSKPHIQIVKNPEDFFRPSEPVVLGDSQGQLRLDFDASIEESPGIHNEEPEVSDEEPEVSDEEMDKIQEKYDEAKKTGMGNLSDTRPHFYA